MAKHGLSIRTGGGAAKTPVKNLIPDDAQLPYEVKTTGGAQLGCAIVMWAGALAALTAGIVMGVLAGKGGTAWIAVIPVTVAVLLAIAGWAAKVYEEHYVFDEHNVTRRWRSLFGRKEWIEPLTQYEGVLAREVYHSGGQNSSSYTQYLVELKHKTDSKKDVELYDSRRHEGHRAQHERYCRLLGVDALRENADGGYEHRAVEDLDKTVRDLVAEGAMDVTFDPSQPPPGEVLTVHIEENGLRVSALGGFTKARKIVGLVTVLSGLVMIGAGLLIPGIGAPGNIILPVLGLLDVAIGQVAIYFMKRAGQELFVSTDTVSSWWVLPWGKVGQESVVAGDVEDVSVRTPPNCQGFTAVVVETDENAIMYGMGMTEEEKRWVRDCIVAVISRGGASDARHEES